MDIAFRISPKNFVVLLALITAQRMQTFAAMQLSNITFSDSLILKIPARLKTSGKGNCQPLFSFKPFADKPELNFYLSVALL
ncbi:hypothetical protein ALC62_10469 [Cyphomyrmex costatus]|uniref:Tyr recombinase domain-containing protein n=1 Tax=Cyphomyrmex costatus TaxID=456900 RepID=A0A151IDT1_9HYME|nr:hypothetical protein ALC62_10469 [Cyphomyrmex costatus]